MAASQVHSFILTAALIGFPASSDVCNENKLLDQRKITTKFSLYKRLSKLFHKYNRTPFLRVYRRDKPTCDVGRTQEKLVNHEPQARDLQALFVFS